MIANVREGFSSRIVMGWLVIVALIMIGVMPSARAADKHDQKSDGLKIMEAFEQQTSKMKPEGTSVIQKKQMTMFFLGVPLLILLLVTGALGIAMGIYGKQVFMLHMICAGLTITLAFVHAILGVIWFYPF